MVALSDIRASAQAKADLANSSSTSFIPTADWNSMINKSVGRLYGIVCDANQDYNVQLFPFTLNGNSQTTNYLDITTLPSLGYQPYHKVRQLEVMIPSGASSDPWNPVKFVPLRDRHRYSRFILNPVLRAPIISAVDWGNRIEIVPAISSAGSYQMLYIPQAPTLVNDTDTIDGYWLTVNGWDEWVALDVAMKAAQKEESSENFQLLALQKAELEVFIKKNASSRNASEPKKVVDADPWGYRDDGWGNPGGYY